MNCEIELEEDDIYEVKGNILCDDCALSQRSNMKKCDPAAVRSAQLDRQRTGHTGLGGLSDLQKNIYKFMKEKGGATMEQFVEAFNLPVEEIDAELTVFRHLELGKGQKREDGIYFVTWDS